MDKHKKHCLKWIRWKKTICVIILAISARNSFAMESNKNCSILIRPGEYVRMRANARLNLSCDLSSYEIDLNKMVPGLWFWENNEHLDDYTKKMTNTMITTLNNLDAKSNSTYTCLASQPVDLAKMKEVVVGDIPAPVHNFTCISHDFENWSCSFKAFERVHTTYVAAYTAGIHKYPCPCINKSAHDFECEGVLRRNTHQIYNFLLTSKNCFGEREQKYSFRIEDQVIPGELALRAISINSTNATLSWNITTENSVLYKNGFVVKVKYGSQDKATWKRLKTFRTAEIQSELKLTDLLPYSQYQVEMQVKAAKAKIAPEMWRHAAVSFKTLSARPLNAPITDPGGFYIDNSRCIHVFWRAFPEYMFNGTNFNYRVHVETVPKRNSMTVKTDKFFYKHSLCEAGDYEFSIYTENSKGSSNRGSTVRVVIPKDDRIQGLPKPSGIKSIFNETAYMLEWTPPEYFESLNLTEYTIFTCSSKVHASSFELCEDSIEFVHVPANQSRVSLPGKGRRHLIFAVSANYKQGSSGMAMSHCVPHENAALGRIDPKADDITSSSVKLKWSLTCQERALVTGFIIQSCILSSETKKCIDHQVKISSTSYDQTGYTINDLKPFTNYSFEIKMFSKVKNGPFSMPLTLQTSQGAPSPPLNLRICTIRADGATMEWERPAFPNGVIRYYYMVMNGSRFREIEADSTQRVVYYNLTNLESHSTYSIAVKAATLSGAFTLEGSSSDLVALTTRRRDWESVRSSHVEVEGNVLKISWDPPREYDQASNVITYELKWLLGDKWEYQTVKNETNYSVRCSQSKRIEIFIRSFIETSSNYPATCQSEQALRNQVVRVNQSPTQEDHWLLVYKFYCDSNSSEWDVTTFLLVLLVITIFLLVFVALYRKHKKMKSLSLVVPPGLDDIMENSPKSGLNIQIAFNRPTQLQDQSALAKYSPRQSSIEKISELKSEHSYMPMHGNQIFGRSIKVTEKDTSVEINTESSSAAKKTILVQVRPTAYVEYESSRPVVTDGKISDNDDMNPSETTSLAEADDSCLKVHKVKNLVKNDDRLALQTAISKEKQQKEKRGSHASDLELRSMLTLKIGLQIESKPDHLTGYVAVPQIGSQAFAGASGYVKMEELSRLHGKYRSSNDEESKAY